VFSFYNIGERKINIIHTKLRHRCSGLNADLYRVNWKNDPRCVCGHLFEDAIHFFLECPLYQHDVEGKKDLELVCRRHLSVIVIIITEIICYCFSNRRMLFIFFLNVHFINTIEFLCLAILITLFPSL
jgi:hypothetical protein